MLHLPGGVPESCPLALLPHHQNVRTFTCEGNFDPTDSAMSPSDGLRSADTRMHGDRGASGRTEHRQMSIRMRTPNGHSMAKVATPTWNNSGLTGERGSTV